MIAPALIPASFLKRARGHCFTLGYEKARRDAKHGKLYEPDYGVSHASTYAEVGVRVAGTGPVPIALKKLLDLIRED